MADESSQKKEWQPWQPPPYMQPPILHAMKWRPDDVVISAPPKSGTNWMMQIVYQLISGGDDSFTDLAACVPWAEFPAGGITQTPEQRAADFEKMSGRRAFKSHMFPGPLPFRDDVHYVVVVRNPKDACCSFVPFLNAHTDEFRAKWNGFPPQCSGLDELLHCFWLPMKADASFVNAWWPHRHKPNVMMIHFNELKKDLTGYVSKVAKFLSIDLPEDKMKRAIEHCTFEWMKENAQKFDYNEAMADGTKILQPGSLVRKGQVGESATMFTPELHAEFDAYQEKEIPDAACRNWLNNGGPLP